MIMVAVIPNCYESVFCTGMNQQIIAGKIKSSRHFVQNVLRDYYLHVNNSSMHLATIKNGGRCR